MAAFILDHFSRQGVDPHCLLKGSGVSKKKIDNFHNWMSAQAFQRIIQNCYSTVPNITLYDWQHIASKLDGSVVGNFFKGVTSLVGPQTIYLMAPRYIKRSSNYQYLETVSLVDGEADFMVKVEPEVVPITSGYAAQIAAGVLAAVPTSNGILPAKIDILYDQASLKDIVKRMYRPYGLSFRQKGDAIIIGGKIIGRKIHLEEEEVNGQKIFSADYLEKKPYNAALVTQDLTVNDTVLLRKGDIFDAPYGRMYIRWEKDALNRCKPQGIKDDGNLAKQTFILLEEQIKLAEDRFFESEKLREKEKKVSVKLKMANRILKAEISERKRAEKLLKFREKEMEAQTANLQAANTALKVLLKKREEDKEKFSERVLFNIKELIIPYLGKLKKTELKTTQRAYVEILESNLEELSNPLALKLSFKYFNLTRTEIRVAIMIKQGRTTQQIADHLKLSPRTIDAYRANIRQKLKIRNKKINLCTYLNSI